MVSKKSPSKPFAAQAAAVHLRGNGEGVARRRARAVGHLAAAYPIGMGVGALGLGGVTAAKYLWDRSHPMVNEYGTGLAKKFPARWGPPPEAQTRDLIELPGGYGMGSTTLSRWITSKLKEDAAGSIPDAPEVSPDSDGIGIGGMIGLVVLLAAIYGGRKIQLALRKRREGARRDDGILEGGRRDRLDTEAVNGSSRRSSLDLEDVTEAAAPAPNFPALPVKKASSKHLLLGTPSKNGGTNNLTITPILR